MAKSGDDLLGAVAAVVIDDDDLVSDADGIEDGADVVEQAGQILRLAQRGNDQRQLLVGARLG